MKIDIKNWLSNKELEQVELIRDVVDVDSIPEQLINFDRVYIYNCTKRELGEEIAGSYGIFDDVNDDVVRHFDYESFADENLDSDCYFELEEDNKYLYIDEIATSDDSIMIGRMKDGFANNQFVKLSKHDWACEWYWSFGHISNNGLSCGISEYLQKPLNEAFENTWISSDLWDKFRVIYIKADEIKKSIDRITVQKEDIIDERGNNRKIEALLNEAWSILHLEYKKISFKA